MYDIDYVKNNIDEFEEDTFLDRRFTKRFIDFLKNFSKKTIYFVLN